MTVPLHSLVLYKKHPALVLQSGEKVEIELEDSSRAWVRPKDIILLHAGPLHSLKTMETPAGEVKLAWEMLSDTPTSSHTLEELAELIYGTFTPASAWAAWKLVEDGLLFYGKPEAILVHNAGEVAAQQAARQARQREAEAWESFVKRACQGQINPDLDRNYLREVEELACGKRTTSRLLSELGRPSRPETAHALLLDSGFWDMHTNPYPVRLNLPTSAPVQTLPPLPDEPRRDLTSLPAYAIDDRENKDPDDAISLDSIQLDAGGNLAGGRLWVHVADVAALAPPDSLLDLEARERGATLYLPEGPVPMLPQQAMELLGLGLQEISPALSLGITLDSQGEITNYEVLPTWVRVQRLSYEQANEQIASSADLLALQQLAHRYQSRREANGALSIDLPEAILRVVDDKVQIRPVTRQGSRELVREAMLMAGEAAARFSMQHNIPFPYATQEAPDSPPPALAEDDLAGRFALRRQLKRSGVSIHPWLHAGLGLSAYSRATSPLRRYLDLVAHQQLRAFIRGEALLNEQAILERIGAAEAITGSINQAEALSRRHWTLVYFLQNPTWQGEAVLVEKQGLRSRVIIPELAFETTCHLRKELPLNSRLQLAFNKANLAELEASFISHS